MVTLLVTLTVDCDAPRGDVQARTSLRHFEGLPRLQRTCERFGIAPTYLVPYPVATRAEGEGLADLAARGRCEIGAYLQPWSTPPFAPTEDRLTALAPSRVAASAVSAKLAALTEALESRLGVRAESHRAALHGLDGATLQALERLGYRVDSSAVPYEDTSPRGGIDWRDAPEVPYFPDRQQPALRGASPILEVPFGVGFDRVLPTPVSRWLARRPGAVRRCDRLGLRRVVPHRVAFDPVAHEGAALRRLAEVAIARGLPCLHVNLQSNELWPGESGRNATTEEVERTHHTLDGFLRYAVDELRATPRTLAGFARHYLHERA